MREHWTPERIEQLRAAYLSGGSAAAMRAFPGRSAQFLRTVAQRFGIKMPIAQRSACQAHGRGGKRRVPRRIPRGPLSSKRQRCGYCYSLDLRDGFCGHCTRPLAA